MSNLVRTIRTLPLLLIAPAILLIAFLCVIALDAIWILLGRPRKPSPKPPFKRPQSASVVIPNWNGRDLLEKYLPSVIAAMRHNPANEIIVVDNGSSDGSADFVRKHFPEVKLLALDRNLGFGGGSNAGFRAATNDIVVLLNSDMRVDPGFLQPLLDGFTDDRVFAVACQIFFSDPDKLREETGLTQGWWHNGMLRVRHRIDKAINDTYPCFYGGGGSCAFDRRKFLEIGGFDRLLAPFYLEDTDLGYLAWKRGWKVLYQPRSIVYHEHRGTIGKHFSQARIQSVLKKNYILFCWKNIHDLPMIASHFFFVLGDSVFSALFGDAPQRSNAAGLWWAFRQLPSALASRWRARTLSAVSDREAFRRPLGGYYRDRFGTEPGRPHRLNVLFVSPYPICPPVHGGGVFMYQTLCELTRHADVHLIVLLDHEHERAPHAELASRCASVEFVMRKNSPKKIPGSILPYAVREFASDEVEWLIHRQMYLHDIDVLQLEYTALAQYGGKFERLACVLFEHDIYFQSVARALPDLRPVPRLKAAWEYLCALHYELRVLRKFDRVQTCSAANREYLLSFAPSLGGRVLAGLRAGIQAARYDFRRAGREPDTMLFIGSFRHAPNHAALQWFANSVLPRVLERRPQAKLVIVGSDPPPRYSLPNSESIELAGFVEDVREVLSRYAVFVCPILSGSGVRVKLLEAFASGIPAVSTRLGAEGLAAKDGEICALADDPAEFASKIVHLLEHPEAAAQMADRARQEVLLNWDMPAITEKLMASYREILAEKTGTSGRRITRVAAGEVISR